MCTSSIWHMCILSVDRYLTLRYPVGYGRNRTQNTMALKIATVWIISIICCSPLTYMGFSDYSTVYNDSTCAPSSIVFIAYGSIIAFYVPLTIMLVTYTLTVRILRRNHQHMKMLTMNSAKSRPGGPEEAETNGKTSGWLQPNTSSSVQNPHTSSCQETSVSYLNSSSTQTGGSKQEVPQQPPPLENNHRPTDASPEEICDEDGTQPGRSASSCSPIGRHQLVATTMHSQFSCSQPALSNFSRNRAMLSVSSHPTLLHPNSRLRPLSPLVQSRPQIVIVRTAEELESVRNFETISAGASLNSLEGSCRSSASGASWSDWNDDEAMLERLSQIEAEMDECLTGEKNDWTNEAPVFKQELGTRKSLETTDFTRGRTNQTTDLSRAKSLNIFDTQFNRANNSCFQSPPLRPKKTLPNRPSTIPIRLNNNGTAGEMRRSPDMRKSPNSFINNKLEKLTPTELHQINIRNRIGHHSTTSLERPRKPRFKRSHGDIAERLDKGMKKCSSRISPGQVEGFNRAGSVKDFLRAGSVSDFFTDDDVFSSLKNRRTDPSSFEKRKVTNNNSIDFSSRRNFLNSVVSSPQLLTQSQSTLRRGPKRLTAKDRRAMKNNSSETTLKRHSSDVETNREDRADRRLVNIREIKCDRECCRTTRMEREQCNRISTRRNTKEVTKISYDDISSSDESDIPVCPSWFTKLRSNPEVDPPTHPLASDVCKISQAKTSVVVKPSPPPNQNNNTIPPVMVSSPASVTPPSDEMNRSCFRHHAEQLALMEYSDVSISSADISIAWQISSDMPSEVMPMFEETEMMKMELSKGNLRSAPKSGQFLEINPNNFLTVRPLGSSSGSAEVESSVSSSASGLASDENSSDVGPERRIIRKRARKYRRPERRYSEPSLSCHCGCCGTGNHQKYRYYRRKPATRSSSQLEALARRASRNERKASKVLGIILIAFVIFWTPFFIFNVYTAFFYVDWGVSSIVGTSVMWWGYTSSLANPVIYTLFSESFRAAFCRILTCQYCRQPERRLSRQSIRSPGGGSQYYIGPVRSRINSFCAEPR